MRYWLIFKMAQDKPGNPGWIRVTESLTEFSYFAANMLEENQTLKILFLLACTEIIEKKKSASSFKCFTNFQPFIFLRGLQCEQPDMAHYPQKACLALCLHACAISSVLYDKIISSTETCALIRLFPSWIHWPLTPTGPNCLTAFCYIRL